MNGSTSTGSHCLERTSLTIKLSLTLAYGVLILASLLGNSLLLAVVRRDRTTKRTIIYFIQNMAVADLLITVVYMSRMIAVVWRGYQWLLTGATGLALCVLVPLCHHSAILVSIQTLVIISVERFLAIIYPLKRNITTKQAKYLVALTWIVSITARIPRSVALRLKYRETSGKTYCATMFSSVYEDAEIVRKIYYETLLYLFYVVPVISIVAVNLVIILTLKRRKPPGHWTSREQKRKVELNRKIFRTLLIITCLFIVCWLLYFIVLLIPNRKFKCEIAFARFFVAHSNSAITPYVYFYFKVDYRRNCKRLLCRPFSQTVTTRGISLSNGKVHNSVIEGKSNNISVYELQ